MKSYFIKLSDADKVECTINIANIVSYTKSESLRTDIYLVGGRIISVFETVSYIDTAIKEAQHNS